LDFSLSLESFFLTISFFCSENPIIRWEVQSLFHLWVSPACCLLVLWNRLWSVSQFCCFTVSQKWSAGLSSVHSDHPNAESFHLKPE
jgi:hypothetical protein